MVHRPPARPGDDADPSLSPSSRANDGASAGTRIGVATDTDRTRSPRDSACRSSHESTVAITPRASMSHCDRASPASSRPSTPAPTQPIPESATESSAPTPTSISTPGPVASAQSRGERHAAAAEITACDHRLANPKIPFMEFIPAVAPSSRRSTAAPKTGRSSCR